MAKRDARRKPRRWRLTTETKEGVYATTTWPWLAKDVDGTQRRNEAVRIKEIKATL